MEMKIKKVDYCTPYQIILVKKNNDFYRFDTWYFKNETDMYKTSRILYFLKPKWLESFRINIEDD